MTRSIRHNTEWTYTCDECGCGMDAPGDDGRCRNCGAVVGGDGA